MINGKLVMAESPSAKDFLKIKKQFKEILGEDIDLDLEIDPSVLGGFIAEIGGKKYNVFDKSFAASLDQIRRQLAGADLTTSADVDFKKMASDIISDFKPNEFIENIGKVVTVGDGVIHINGMEGCRYGELLCLEDGTRAIAQNLSKDSVGAVLLGKGFKVIEGMDVHRTGEVLSIPVGAGLFGRVVDPLGMPMDGKGKVNCKKMRKLESEAPGIIDRADVSDPLQTGILSIDSMIPIGKGQRELIIGDRQTGKTAIAVDTILNQKGKDVVCIYVAIGQKASTVADVVKTLEESGAMEYSLVVASLASDTAPMQYIAPYAGCAIAEEFMHEGKDVLVVYDDLSKHAVAYRAMSLLLRRPPGREAYPGDVFYLHSRLLERAAKLKPEHGGGSMTALPIIETMAGDISAYIPTNVISITDGQIFLETELFNAGMRPAVNVGLSVSRVGGAAQTKAMRRVAGKLRLELAQYRELAVFSQFASDLDKVSQEQLQNGERLTQTLIQPQYEHMTQAEQVIVLAMATRRKLLGISVRDISEFNLGFVDYVSVNHPEIKEAIIKTNNISDEDLETLVALSDEYKKVFSDRVKKRKKKGGLT